MYMSRKMGWCLASQHGDNVCRTQYVDWMGLDVRCSCECHAHYKWDDKITENARITAPDINKRARKVTTKTTNKTPRTPTNKTVSEEAREAQRVAAAALADIEADESIISEIEEQLK
jgi:hypothetical protein